MLKKEFFEREYLLMVFAVFFSVFSSFFVVGVGDITITEEGSYYNLNDPVEGNKEEEILNDGALQEVSLEESEKAKEELPEENSEAQNIGLTSNNPVEGNKEEETISEEAKEIQKEDSENFYVDIDKIISMVDVQIELDGEYIKNEWKEIGTGKYDRWGQEYTKMVRFNDGESTADNVKSTFGIMESKLYNETDYDINTELVEGVYKYWNSIEVTGRVVIEEQWNQVTESYEDVEVTVYSGYEEFLIRTKEYGQKKRVRTMDISKIIE